MYLSIEKTVQKSNHKALQKKNISAWSVYSNKKNCIHYIFLMYNLRSKGFE